MELVYIVITLAVILYIGTAMYCGVMRGRHKVMAPSMDGPPAFQRALRIQMNTLETLVPFIPTCLLFGLVIDPVWAAGLGLVWVIGRMIYAVSYSKDPAKRGLGFIIAFSVQLALIVGVVVGSIQKIAIS